MEMARRSAALLCVLLYHAAPALAFVAPGALAPGRPAFQVPLRSRDTAGAVPQACELMKEAGTAGASEAPARARRRPVALQTPFVLVAPSCISASADSRPCLPRSRARAHRVAGDDLLGCPWVGAEFGGVRAEACPPHRDTADHDGRRGGCAHERGQVRAHFLLVRFPDCLECNLP